MTRLQENLNPLNKSITIACKDALMIDQWNTAPFDAILLDAPCSATGTLQAHPEILITSTPQQQEALIATQRKLLNTLWQHLKPGGYLLYSTCSIHPDENENQIAAFVDHKEDEIKQIETMTLSTRIQESEQGGYAHLLVKKPVDST